MLPRLTNISFMPRLSTSFPSNRQLATSIKTHGPLISASSRSGLYILFIFFLLFSSSSAFTSFAFVLPLHTNLCSLSVVNTLTFTLTTGFTSNVKNFNPGMASSKKPSSSLIVSSKYFVIFAPNGNGTSTYCSTGSRM